MIVNLQCRKCKKIFEINVSQSEMDDYNKGEKTIQCCFPNLTCNERELFISQTCGKCFDKIFNECEKD